MKKLLSLLLALSFTVVFAYDDDDYDDDYYEDEAPKKAAKKAAAPAKKAAKASSESGNSRMGLSVAFSGGSDLAYYEGGFYYPTIGFVYDLGSGIELGLGLGLYRYQKTLNEGDDPDPIQRVAIIPSVSYGLGKGLLDYGIGADVGIILEPTTGERPDGGTSFFGVLNFYTSAELVKNVSLKLSAGLRFDKPAEVPDTNENYKNGYSEMTISLATSGTIIFYFL